MDIGEQMALRNHSSNINRYEKKRRMRTSPCARYLGTLSMLSMD